MTPLAITLLAAALVGWLVWVQRRTGVFLEYLYFCRFPLAFGMLLAALPAIALWGAPSLLANLFHLTPGEILLISFFGTLTAWTVLITLELIIAYAPSRFRVPRLRLPHWMVHYRIPLFSLLALPLIATAVAQSRSPLGKGLAMAAGGMVLAAAVLLLATWVYGKVGGTIPLVLEALPRVARGRGSSHGYVDPKRKLGRGHILAAAAFGVAVFLYVLGYLFLRPDRVLVPSLGYILLLLLVAGWGLPGLSFFLDRYRVPVVFLVLAASFLSSQVFDTDHYYRIERQTAPPPPLPGQAFNAAEQRLGEGDRPIVVVAASGGGITASLWTARVLTALQGEVGTGFTRSIRLISSVSGGSVGTMYFLDRYTPAGFPPPADLGRIVNAAGASSLDATAWGLVYPDLWRIFFGFLPRDKTLDRGWAMEQAWKRQLTSPDRMLSQWRTGLREGWLPAPVLNSTVVETGEQFLLTPLDLPAGWRTRRFDDVYPGYDLPVVTAARLSATFPWVSPIAQARGEKGSPPKGFRQLHLADGGYYDNFGVVTAVNWLRSLLPSHLDDLRRRGVLLVLIRAFPEAAEPRAGGGSARARQGWLFATAGPLLTMYNVRTSTQAFHNNAEVGLLKELWERGYKVKLDIATFELEKKAPLSWRLTDTERRAILNGWNEPRNRASLGVVKGLFLAGR
ncbi:MAG TPA: patatin-like phospholipase family protein [Thermoanaerobaculia bacterium]|jgi:hypothetical protein|nr:patatin-like phospholipase family protein [Thermoanaerobaculia bacterium]